MPLKNRILLLFRQICYPLPSELLGHVSSPHIILKFQCLLVDSSIVSYLNENFKSSVMNQTSPDLSEVVIRAAESSSSRRFGI